MLNPFSAQSSEAPTPIKETFVRRFWDGHTAALRVIAEDGAACSFDVEWTPKLPSAARFLSLEAEYQAWRNESLKAFVQRHGLSTACLIDPGPVDCGNVTGLKITVL